MEEIWKDIPGYPGYQASNLGNIKSLDRYVVSTNPKTGEKINRFFKEAIKDQCYTRGYLKVTIDNDTRSVHRLVSLAFMGTPPTDKHQVNHKNGIKDDNRIENLEWVTQSENSQHSVDVLGRPPPNQIPLNECFKVYKHVTDNNLTHEQAAQDLGLGRKGVTKRIRYVESCIKDGTVPYEWKEYISSHLPMSDKEKHLRSCLDVLKLSMESNLTNVELGKQLNLNHETVSRKMKYAREHVISGDIPSDYKEYFVQHPNLDTAKQRIIDTYNFVNTNALSQREAGRLLDVEHSTIARRLEKYENRIKCEYVYESYEVEWFESMAKIYNEETENIMLQEELDSITDYTIRL